MHKAINNYLISGQITTTKWDQTKEVVCWTVASRLKSRESIRPEIADSHVTTSGKNQYLVDELHAVLSWQHIDRKVETHRSRLQTIKTWENKHLREWTNKDWQNERIIIWINNGIYYQCDHCHCCFENIFVTTSDLLLLPHPFVALCSLNRQDLFVPRTRTTMAKSRSFSIISPSLWKRLPRSARASFLSSNFSTSLFLLKTCLFPWS